MAEDKKVVDEVKSGAEVKVAKRAAKADTSSAKQSGVKTSGVKG